MSQTRYLTKSRFKLAMECPTKLFYTGKPAYANQKIADSFLAALADGGFQVAELARCYFPEGIRVETPNDETAVQVTEQYLHESNITLFEAAFRFGSLLIRADIVEKKGNELKLYEVKAKSCDFDTEAGMLNQNGALDEKNVGSTLEAVEREYILQVLRHTSWVIGGPSGAAASLGLNRSTLNARMRKLDITRPRPV